MKRIHGIERVDESTMLHAIINRRVGNYICPKENGGVMAATIGRAGRIRIGEFSTASDACAWLNGRDTHDLFGNYVEVNRI